MGGEDLCMIFDKILWYFRYARNEIKLAILSFIYQKIGYFVTYLVKILRNIHYCQNPNHNLNTTQDNLNCSWV